MNDDWWTNLSKKIENPPKLKQRNSFCMWSDLLGFGNIYSDNDWKLNARQRRKVYNRLVEAHSAVLRCSQHTERNLILNDGIAKVYMPDDSIFGKREISNIALYLRFCVELHKEINKIEKANGYPGCRSVMAFGECIEYLAEEIKFDDYVLNYTKPKGQEISSMAKENGNPTIIYNPKELQMNTAFSKAYILEGGRLEPDLPESEKNRLYVDQSVIDAVIKYAKRRGFTTVWQELDDELRLLIPYDKDNLNEVVLGFAFDKKVIIPNQKLKYSTTQVYRLLKFFPHDEPVDEFYFDLTE